MRILVGPITHIVAVHLPITKKCCINTPEFIIKKRTSFSLGPTNICRFYTSNWLYFYCDHNAYFQFPGHDRLSHADMDGMRYADLQIVGELHVASLGLSTKSQLRLQSECRKIQINGVRFNEVLVCLIIKIYDT